MTTSTEPTSTEPTSIDPIAEASIRERLAQAVEKYYRDTYPECPVNAWQAFWEAEIERVAEAIRTGKITKRNGESSIFGPETIPEVFRWLDAAYVFRNQNAALQQCTEELEAARKTFHDLGYPVIASAYKLAARRAADAVIHTEG